jgi:hypothetical protein
MNTPTDSLANCTRGGGAPKHEGLRQSRGTDAPKAAHQLGETA